MNMEFSIKAIRINAGLTQEQVAEILGITKRVYSDKENGVQKFYFTEVKKICSVTNFPISQVKDC